MLEKKAKAVTIFLSALFTWGSLYADLKIPEKALVEKIDMAPQEDELLVIDKMIDLMEKQQKALSQLKKILVDLRHNEQQFLKGDHCKLYARYLISDATQALSLIRDNHLEHLFSSDFIQELAIYTKIGKK